MEISVAYASAFAARLSRTALALLTCGVIACPPQERGNVRPGAPTLHLADKNGADQADGLTIHGLHRFIGQEGDTWLRGFIDVSEKNFADGKIPDNFTIEAKDSLPGWDVVSLQWTRPNRRIISCGYNQRWWVNFGSKQNVLDWSPPEQPRPIVLELFLEKTGDYGYTENDLLGYTNFGEPVCKDINHGIKLELYPNVLGWE